MNLLQNDLRIKKLFTYIFSNIKFDDVNLTLPEYSDLNKIISIIKLQTYDTLIMIKEINKFMSIYYSFDQILYIYKSLNIITDTSNALFSIQNSNNSLNRSLIQASYFNGLQDITLSDNLLNNIKSNSNSSYFINNKNVLSLYNKDIIKLITESNIFTIDILISKCKLSELDIYQQLSKNNNFINQKTVKSNNIIDQKIVINNESKDIANPQLFLNSCSELDIINQNLNIKLLDMQSQFNNFKLNNQFEYNSSIDKIKAETKNFINKYIDLLYEYLLKNETITINEVNNLNNKLNNNEIDHNFVVNFLENKKSLNVKTNLNDIFTNKSIEYVQRPPLCISDYPNKVNQSNYLSNYATFK